VGGRGFLTGLMRSTSMRWVGLWPRHHRAPSACAHGARHPVAVITTIGLNRPGPGRQGVEVGVLPQGFPQPSRR
jgi:hypothetical protein